MRKITQLTLSFPHGVNIRECEEIVKYSENVVMAGVSEGGMATTSKYGLNVEDVTFSEDCMHYVFGHNRLQCGEKKEKCNKCGRVDFAIARDMKSTRHCKCGNKWLPRK